MIDLSNPEQVKAEAERRERLRAAGKPLVDGGGVARLASPVPPLLPATARRGNTEGTPLKHRPPHEWIGEPSPHLRAHTVGDPPIAWRKGDQLWLMIPVTARSKKNSTMLGIRKSPAYVRFRNALVSIVTPFVSQLQLPLPDVDYNCAAHFFMEREAADTDNLMSGLADALQDAKVLADDFRIRTWNGSDRFVDAAHPRIEVTLTPYTGGQR